MEQNTAVEKAEPEKRFTGWLKDHRSGLADSELAEVLEEVITAVARTGKKGALKLQLNITREGDMVAITDLISCTVPEDRESRLYWVDLDGRLTRHNPLQPTLLDDEDDEE